MHYALSHPNNQRDYSSVLRQTTLNQGQGTQEALDLAVKSKSVSADSARTAQTHQDGAMQVEESLAAAKTSLSQAIMAKRGSTTDIVDEKEGIVDLLDDSSSEDMDMSSTSSVVNHQPPPPPPPLPPPLQPPR